MTYEVGCRIDRGLPPIDLRLLTSAGRGENLLIEYFDNPELAGAPVATELAHTARVLWIGPPQTGLTVGACSVRLSAVFTPDVSGAWRLGLESAGRAVLRLDGAEVVDNSEPSRGSSFYGAGSEPVEVTVDLAAGHAYELAVEMWPRSSSSPIMGARLARRRRTPATSSNVPCAPPPRPTSRWSSSGRTGSGNPRGTTARPLAARPSTRARRGRARGQSTHRRRRQRGLPRRDAVGDPGRGRPHDLVPGGGGGGRAGRHGGRGVRAVGTAARHVSRPCRGRAGGTGRGGRPVSGRRGRGRLRGGRPRGLPLLRDGPSGAALPLRLRALLRRHRLLRRGGGRGRHLGDRHAGEQRDPTGHRGRAGLRARDGVTGPPPRPGAGRLRQGQPRQGGRETVRLELGAAAFRYWDVDTHAWRSDPGRYEVLVGASSRESGRARWSPGAARRRRDGRRRRAGAATSDAPRPWTWTWDRLLVEPRRPEAIRERPDAHWFAVAAVCVGAFMGQLDASIVTVALPTLQRTFGVSVGAVTWVGLSYLLVLVATVIAVGRFADMWGRKLLYVYGFLIFTFASVLCGLAPGPRGAVRLPGAAGDRRGDVAGEQPGHHRAGRARPLVGAGHRPAGYGPGARTRPGAVHRWAAPRRRWLAPHLLRERPLRALRRRWPRSSWCPAAATSSARVRFDWTGLGIFFPAVVALLSAISFGAELGWSST